MVYFESDVPKLTLIAAAVLSYYLAPQKHHAVCLPHARKLTVTTSIFFDHTDKDRGTL